MRVFVLFMMMMALSSGAALGQIAVEILDLPAEVYSFEPVYVLYAIENTGRSPVYLPAEAAPHHGHGLYSAPLGETPQPPRGLPVGDRLFDHAEKTMWLAPGERWMFYEDVGSQLGVLEGEMAVQAVMSSDGRCGDLQVHGRQSFSLEPLYLETIERARKQARIYRCWEGEARSNVRTVKVIRSTSLTDQEAFDYLVEQRGIINVPETGAWKLKASAYRVKERYPTSHFAYAVLATGFSKAHEKMRAIELQPLNPLNPWVTGALARQVLEHQSSCRELKPPTYDFYGSSVPSAEGLEVSEGIREYLDQYSWYLENRYCPLVRSEHGTESDQGE